MMVWPHWEKGAEMIKKYVVRTVWNMNFIMANRGLKNGVGKNTCLWKLPHEGLNTSRGAGTTKLHTALRSATNRGSILCGDILPFSTAYIRTTYPMGTTTSYMWVRRPDHEVKHSPHLLIKSKVRETSPFTHESSHPDAEPQTSLT